jgi:hypothetical protein
MPVGALGRDRVSLLFLASEERGMHVDPGMRSGTEEYYLVPSVPQVRHNVFGDFHKALRGRVLPRREAGVRMRERLPILETESQYL